MFIAQLCNKALVSYYCMMGYFNGEIFTGFVVLCNPPKSIQYYKFSLWLCADWLVKIHENFPSKIFTMMSF